MFSHHTQFTRLNRANRLSNSLVAAAAGSVFVPAGRGQSATTERSRSAAWTAAGWAARRAGRTSGGPSDPPAAIRIPSSGIPASSPNGPVLSAPIFAQAAVAWSSCQTITGVTVQPVGSNILVSLSPGIGGCSSQGVAGAITFSAGQLGLAAGELSGLLASSLSALSLGRQVLIAVDASTPNCYATSVSVGGYSGQCP
jgi:hypothetical protein